MYYFSGFMGLFTGSGFYLIIILCLTLLYCYWQANREKQIPFEKINKLLKGFEYLEVSLLLSNYEIRSHSLISAKYANIHSVSVWKLKINKTLDTMPNDIDDTYYSDHVYNLKNLTPNDETILLSSTVINRCSTLKAIQLVSTFFDNETKGIFKVKNLSGISNARSYSNLKQDKVSDDEDKYDKESFKQVKNSPREKILESENLGDLYKDFDLFPRYHVIDDLIFYYKDLLVKCYSNPMNLLLSYLFPVNIKRITYLELSGHCWMLLYDETTLDWIFFVAYPSDDFKNVIITWICIDNASSLVCNAKYCTLVHSFLKNNYICDNLLQSPTIYPLPGEFLPTLLATATDDSLSFEDVDSFKEDNDKLKVKLGSIDFEETDNNMNMDDEYYVNDSLLIENNAKTIKKIEDILDNSEFSFVENTKSETPWFGDKISIEYWKSKLVNNIKNLVKQAQYINTMNLNKKDEISLDDSNGWKFTAVHKTVAIFNKLVIEKPLIYSYISKSFVNKPVVNVVNFLMNASNRFVYDDLVKEINIVQKISDNTSIVNLKYDMRGWFKKDVIDFCYLQSYKKFNNTHIISIESVDCELCSLSTNSTRGLLNNSGWIVQSRKDTDSKESIVTYVINMDLQQDKSHLFRKIAIRQIRSINQVKKYFDIDFYSTEYVNVNKY